MPENSHPSESAGLEAFFTTMSDDWRRKTGYVPRHPEGTEPRDLTEAERRVETADALKEMRYVLAGVANRTPGMEWTAAMVVTRDRPVGSRELEHAMSRPENHAKGRMSGALVASLALRGLSR